MPKTPLEENGGAAGAAGFGDRGLHTVLRSRVGAWVQGWGVQASSPESHLASPPPHPRSQAPYLYRWSLSPEAPEDSPDPIYREDTGMGWQTCILPHSGPDSPSPVHSVRSHLRLVAIGQGRHEGLWGLLFWSL